MRALQLTLDMSQRWLFGKPKYRPSRETIRPADFEVAEIPDDTTARNFIRQYHYSGSMGAARVRVGRYRHGVLVGVAVFSHPCSDAVLTRTFSVPPASAVELGRFVLLDEVEATLKATSSGGRLTSFAREASWVLYVLRSDAKRSVAGEFDPVQAIVLFRRTRVSTSGAALGELCDCCRMAAFCMSGPSRTSARANAAGELVPHNSRSSAHLRLQTIQTSAECGEPRTSAN